MAETKASALAVDNGDSHYNADGKGLTDPTKPQWRKLHDSSVTFEEYHYYAKLTRAAEDQRHLEAAVPKQGILKTIFPPKSAEATDRTDRHESVDEKALNLNNASHRMKVSDQEWINASRALRTASSAAIFYLITTDILGPFGVPFAIGTLGWGPGVALYTVFGALAAYSGYLLYKMYLGMDSDQYPLRTYGDLAFRLYGPAVRHSFNFLQSIQLLCNVGVIVVGNGQALSQVSKFRLCYAVCCLLFAICGFFIGQVRTLQKYGWLANAAVWMNLLIIFITMGVAAHTDPNYTAAQGAGSGSAVLDGILVTPDQQTKKYPPVSHFGGLPDPSDFVGSINGLMQGVYAYGGAMLFIEFMSEMARPRDFLKGMAAAQFFIYAVYMIYGLVMYHYQGQYAINPSYQGISNYAWQTVGNMIAVISALIAAGLYGNIGIKVLYNSILVEFFRAPALTTRNGKILWAVIVPIYWSIAFIVAASIPNFTGLTSIVAAVCILQFTYTFPPFLHIGYAIKKGAMLAGDGFDPTTGQVTRQDTGFKRILRGFLKHQWWLNLWNIVYLGGALATAGLGAYSAIEGLIKAFEKPSVTAFTCKSPLDPS